MKINRAKKGFMASNLAKMILILAIAIPLLILVGKFTLFAKERGDVEACRFSILAAARSKAIGKGMPIYQDLKCELEDSRELTIKYSDVVERGKINQDKAHKKIADAMAECWNMVGEGRMDPFSNWDTEGSYCLICKEIKFDKKLKEFYKESLSNPEIAQKRGKDGVITSPIPYMITHERKEGQTYFEYIYKSAPTYSRKDIDDMAKQIFLEDSLVLVKMYKHTDKDIIAVALSWGLAAITVIAVVAGVALILSGVGSIIGVSLLAGAAKLAAAGFVMAVITGVGFAGVAMIDPVNLNPFGECLECNGIGSLKLVPPTFDLSEEIDINYGEVKIGKDTKEIKEKGPYCEVLVN